MLELFDLTGLEGKTKEVNWMSCHKPRYIFGDWTIAIVIELTASWGGVASSWPCVESKDICVIKVAKFNVDKAGEITGCMVCHDFGPCALLEA